MFVAVAICGILTGLIIGGVSNADASIKLRVDVLGIGRLSQRIDTVSGSDAIDGSARRGPGADAGAKGRTQQS